MKKLIISLTLGLTLVGSPVIAAEAATTSVPAGDTTVTTTAPANDSTAQDLAATTTVTNTAPTGETAVPATTTAVPEAGLTPESPLYFIDKFIEKVQLALVSAENEAKLLDEIAQERLSEAQAVPEADVKADLLNEYIATVEQVKQLIDKQVASDDTTLLDSVKLGSTRGLTVLKDLAAANPTPGLLNAIDKQETKLAEHLIFAELKQQFKANNEAVEVLEKQIAEGKAAGQDVSALETQLKELQAKAEVLKDSKKLIKGLQKELKQQIRTNKAEFEKFMHEDLEKYEENKADELIIEDQDEDKTANLQKKELKAKEKLAKKQAQLEKKLLKEQIKKEKKESHAREKAEKKQGKESNKE